MNWDNLFIEMCTEVSEGADAFDKIEYIKKIGFVPWETDRKKLLQLKLYPEQREFYEAVNRSVSETGYRFNVLDLLNGKIVWRVE